MCLSQSDGAPFTKQHRDFDQNKDVTIAFAQELSRQTESPVVSYVVRGSNALFFCISHNGIEQYLFDNMLEYFAYGRNRLRDAGTIPGLFSADADEWARLQEPQAQEENVLIEEHLGRLLETPGPQDALYKRGISTEHVAGNTEASVTEGACPSPLLHRHRNGRRDCDCLQRARTPRHSP